MRDIDMPRVCKLNIACFEFYGFLHSSCPSVLTFYVSDIWLNQFERCRKGSKSTEIRDGVIGVGRVYGEGSQFMPHAQEDS